jgi:hypothetical protein
MADVPGEFDAPDVEFDEEPPELVEEELPLAPVVPFEVAEAPEVDESIALEPAPALVTPLHPQPQRARVMSTKKSRKNGESCGRK